MTTAIEEARKMAADWSDSVGIPRADWRRGEADDTLLIQAFLAAIELGERREREAVVGWLRGEVGGPYNDPQYDIGINLADGVERGDHHA